jgi:hypothetical protein
MDSPAPQLDDNQLIAERRAKLAALRAQCAAQGTVAFPNDFKPGHRARLLSQQYGEMPNEELEPLGVEVSVAGRMMLKRLMGKASFATVQDATGRIQLYVQRDQLGEALYGEFKHWDLGDIVGARGTLFRTKTGELSVKVSELRLLTKSLRPLPRQVPRRGRPGAQVPPALRRPDQRRGRARALRAAQPRGGGDARLHGRTRLPGGGDADAPPDPGRRQRQAPSSRTTTRWTRKCSCASRPSST